MLGHERIHPSRRSGDSDRGISADTSAGQTDIDARRTLSELLKISQDPPNVVVEVVSRRSEDGLIVEDLAWPSLDGQRVSAFLIRPETTGRLPAIVCLHGTGGSRESMTTREFGPGQWTTPGAAAPHQRMLGWARELARRGFVTLALTQRGLDRRAPPDTNDQAKDLLVRGRTLMGAIVHEIRQAVTYLERRDDVQARGLLSRDCRLAALRPSIRGWPTVASGRPLRSAAALDRSMFCCAPAVPHITVSTGGSRTCSLAVTRAISPRLIAPRPLMLWAPRRDIGMPKEGVDRFKERVTPAYARHRAEKNLVIHQPDGEHEFTPEAFDAMVSFFETSLRNPEPAR